MNRFQMARQVLLLEAAAAECRKRAAAVRADLDADARAELAEQGTAPTWRMPDIGTVTLPVSKETVYVEDAAALLEWVRRFHPDEIEVKPGVRSSFLLALLAECRGDEGGVVWMREGALVPGLAVRPGGQPQALRFKPNRDAEQVAAAAAERLVDGIEAQLGVVEIERAQP